MGEMWLENFSLSSKMEVIAKCAIHKFLDIVCRQVLNGAMLYWPMPNALYVEGYALDKFAEGSWGLQPVHQNRVMYFAFDAWIVFRFYARGNSLCCESSLNNLTPFIGQSDWVGTRRWDRRGDEGAAFAGRWCSVRNFGTSPVGVHCYRHATSGTNSTMKSLVCFDSWFQESALKWRHG